MGFARLSIPPPREGVDVGVGGGVIKVKDSTKDSASLSRDYTLTSNTLHTDYTLTCQ